MKNKISLLAFSLLLLGCNENKVSPDNVVQKESLNIETEAPFSLLDKKTSIYTTTQNTDLQLANTGQLNFENGQQPLETDVAVFVNPNIKFQSILGIGGAITDASAEVFAKLPEDKQQELLDAYYDQENGIGYSLARTNIHSCDFSSASYTYVEEDDKTLSTFSIEHDQEFRIPLIKKAIDRAGGKLTLFASPWSPPAFMKDTKDMLQGGRLLPEFYDAWAKYFAKFIQAYEAEGMPIWGVTIQNEPMAKQTWESCIYTAEEERDFLKQNLGPTLEAEGLGDKNIVVWDHNRDLINHRANTIFDDPEAAKYAWGIGFHWYETWTGSTPMHNTLGNIKDSYPDMNLLFTEGCNDKFNPEKINSWKNAEHYGNSMINDFNNGTAGWTDWNILLDQQGGPNHVGNFCFSPIHADVTTGELIYTPAYYYIGHFSKFIRPNAKRISTVSSQSFLLSTTFLNEDGSLVTVVMNENDKNIAYKLYIGDKMTEVSIAPHSIQSIVTK